MGTSGLFGFFYKGKYYVAYNHFDSYPSGLGATIVGELKIAIEDGFEKWIKLLSQIKIIDFDDPIPPTDEDIQKLAPYTDLGVSGQSTKDWYCLLRKCQGYLLNYVNKDGTPDWLGYAYIVNLDTQQLDFYKYNSSEPDSYGFDSLPDW